MTENARVLRLQIMDPKVERLDGATRFCLSPLKHEVEMADFREGVSLRQICNGLPKLEISSRHVVVANVDREEPMVVREESTNELKIKAMGVTYVAENRLMTGFLRTGYGGRVVRMPIGIWHRRTIGRVMSGELTGQIVLGDYRFNFGRQRDKLKVDVVWCIYGTDCNSLRE